MADAAHVVTHRAQPEPTHAKVPAPSRCGRCGCGTASAWKASARYGPHPDLLWGTCCKCVGGADVRPVFAPQSIESGVRS